jgi:23S rRNA pseudouridine1911/1915/1917 synthase
MTDSTSFQLVVDTPDQGERLDIFLSLKLTDCSRASARELILARNITVNGFIKKPSYKVKCGETVSGRISSSKPLTLQAESIDLQIIHEDDWIMVVNKQAGLVVHPAPGHLSGTMVNALLFHRPEIKDVMDEMRPGIVHRLDKDTSGLLIIAKTPGVREALIDAFKKRQIKKTYLAIVHGSIREDEGQMMLPIGRHPKDRKRMSTISLKGRHAETAWRVRERFEKGTLLELDLKTGRTHQIRVHCAAMGHPVIGDPVYGKRKKRDIGDASRQMLHAWRIRLNHPITGHEVFVEAPVPEDMKGMIKKLKAQRTASADNCSYAALSSLL